MAVKEEKKETCKKVKLRRDAVMGHPNAPLVSSPPPRTLLRHRSVHAVPPVTSRPISPLMSTDESDSSPNTTVHGNETPKSRDEIYYQGLSVDWILNSPYIQVSRLLRQLDVSTDAELVLEMLQHYSLVIKGLPDCPEEDVPLAVYFFIEDTFSIPSKFVECMRIRQYNGRMDVGVVFDSIRMKYDVLKKDALLEGTEVRMINNHPPWFTTHTGAPNST